MVNLSSAICFHARRDPERIAIVYDAERISYGALYSRIERSAAWLASRGIGPDSVVALLMKNSAAFIELACAVSHVGGVLLPINYRLSAAEVAYILENAGAALLLADDDMAQQ